MQYSLRMLVIVMLVGGPLCAWGLRCWHAERDRAELEASYPSDAFSGKALQPVTFEGVIKKRLKSDGIWAGYLASYQGVCYSVSCVSEGTLPAKEVLVFHALVGPPLCETDEPELSHRIFRVGNRLRVRAVCTEKVAYACGGDSADVTVLAEVSAPPASKNVSR